MVTGQAPRVDPWLAAQARRGLVARHPALNTRKGTIQLRLDDAPGITDDEIHDGCAPPWEA
jgi:hypothetical protein